MSHFWKQVLFEKVCTMLESFGLNPFWVGLNIFVNRIFEVSSIEEKICNNVKFDSKKAYANGKNQNYLNKKLFFEVTKKNFKTFNKITWHHRRIPPSIFNLPKKRQAINLQLFTHKWIGIFHEITTGMSDRGNSISNGFVTWYPHKSDDILHSMPEARSVADDMNEMK